LVTAVEGGLPDMISLIAELLQLALEEDDSRSCVYDALRFAMYTAASGQRSFVVAAFDVLRLNLPMFVSELSVVLRKFDSLPVDVDDFLPLVMMLCSILHACEGDWSVRGDALCAAARFGQLSTVQYLIDTGAAVQHQDNKPLKLALAHGHHQVAELLQSRGAYLPEG